MEQGFRNNPDFGRNRQLENPFQRERKLGLHRTEYQVSFGAIPKDHYFVYQFLLVYYDP